MLQFGDERSLSWSLFSLHSRREGISTLGDAISPSFALVSFPNQTK